MQYHELPATRAPATAPVSGPTLTGMTLDPDFSPGELNYTASVSYILAETIVRPLLADPKETYVVSLDRLQRSSNAPAVIPLHAGPNPITVTVTSADSNNPTTQTYTVVVTREAASTDVTLTELVLGGTSPA